MYLDTLLSSSTNAAPTQKRRAFSLPSIPRPLDWSLLPPSPSFSPVDQQHTLTLDTDGSFTYDSLFSPLSSTVFSGQSLLFSGDELATSSSDNECPISPTLLKGKGRLIEDPPADNEEATRLDDISSMPSQDLNDVDKEEISRRDEEVALAIMIEDLRAEGYSDVDVQQYLLQIQILSAQEATNDPRDSSFSHMREGVQTNISDVHQVADGIMDSLLTRKLPPAYGEDYAPEPSTSSAGSPVLAARRLSISSQGNTDHPWAREDVPHMSSSSAASAPWDQTMQLELELERRLEEMFQRHRREVLREWNDIKASFHQELRGGNSTRGRRVRAAYPQRGDNSTFVPGENRRRRFTVHEQNSSTKPRPPFSFPHLGF
ncbi:hypothetical protein FRC17_006054 [Serendipita sp. 399]|nr:hypothetical protein FRC17_006054 [Serendipita sp. 399]